MKTRSIYRIIEGAFLFTMIIMIYVMSILSAQGQMAKEFPSIYELTQFHNENQVEATDINMESRFNKGQNTYFSNEMHKLFQIQEINQYGDTQIKETNVRLPENTLMKRRNESEHQAPLIIIPF